MESRNRVRLACLTLVLALSCSPPPSSEPLPELWPAPEFELTNFDERQISNSDLEGEPWVGAFIFTRCPGPCPLISQRMKEVQSQMEEGTSLVSFSVDPQFDTPAVMRTYSTQWSTNQENWHFLTTSDPQEVKDLAEGFKIAAAQIPAAIQEAIPDIVHGTHIFVVDSRGMVRAVVASSDPDASQQVLAILRQLSSEVRID